ncbi:unnamed protein product [Medioppia subpectinata]|uniref:Uncharacterized protein n=1 Tax=Medioppia subpectinata TaxID=1979941 RepID=A0A7R9LGK9_9ACAR|nr:unnamed protein product [Medioppia subpectinata]CAG2118661.1 unnamed protein product [Medioppia subpectinata]
MNDHISWDQFKQLGINCPKLKRLSFGMCCDSIDTFSKLIQTINDYFNQIKRLEFDDYFPDGYDNDIMWFDEEYKDVTHWKSTKIIGIYSGERRQKHI